MIDADYAGILFTEHPAQSGTLLVEMTNGLADNLASGSENAHSYGYGRLSGRLHSGEEPPVDLMPLVELALRIESLFGQPQDVEWAYRKERFYILQARNITAMERINPAVTAKGVFERERHRLLELGRGCGADDTVLAQNELSELLPCPTPLSLSFMEELWKPGGSVDLACHGLGVPYAVQEDSHPLVVSVFGALYVNMQEQRRRSGKGIGVAASFRLSRAAENIERVFREDFLPTYLSELRLLEAMDFGRIPTSDLIGLLEDTSERYFHESHVPGRHDQHRRRLLRQDGRARDAQAQDEFRRGAGAGRALGHASGDGRAAAAASGPGDAGGIPVGLRTPVDGRLRAVPAALPRGYRDDGEPDPQRGLAQRQPGPWKGAAVLPGEGTLSIAITRARRFQLLKEEAKHYALREFAVLRRMFVELDRRLDLDGGIFYLELGEIAQLRHGDEMDALKGLIAERRTAADFYASMKPLGTAITLHELETMDMSDGGEPDLADEDGALRGSLVAGSEAVVGRARVLSGQDIQSVGQGEIVVARYMHPSWTPVFPRLKGIVTEVGGWLSHTSILAREYNITTIIGVKAAEYRVKTGDLLRLNLDGTVEILERGPAKDDSDEENTTESIGRPASNDSLPEAMRAGAD